VSIVVFAVLASSASAGSAPGRAPLPSKDELQGAGQTMFRQGRISFDRHALGSLALRELVAPSSGTTTRGIESSRRSGVALSALESSLLAGVNGLRRRHGLSGLTLSRGLSSAAAYHSQQMIQHGFFEHESRGGGAFWKRVERFYASRGFRSWEVGENLAYGAPDLTATAAIRMWMNSPGHRENLLSHDWREIGLGAVHVTSAGGQFGGAPVTVITADFGARVR
jgi:uncharacterized protein YkwD